MGKRFPGPGEHEPTASLWVGEAAVAEYVTCPEVDSRRGPRPYLHPVRTLAGTVVTDVQPEDHPHHLGVSVAMQDVSGANLWGGRTYVRGQGYTWRDDHGRIEHDAWLDRAPDRLANRMRWCAPDGRALLVEDREVTAASIDDRAWLMRFSYALTNTGSRPVTLGSPATNGRPGKAGYGGFFWRLAPGHPEVFDPVADTEAEVNGSAAEWVAAVGGAPDRPYTLVFWGLGDGDRWFVRAAEYPGVCVALAFTEVRVIEPGASLRRTHRIAIVDGALDRRGVIEMLGAAGHPAPTA
ncbi:MAG TPA: PmoA family protein [Micromonosporaceae bacterium]|nr:PmoA family protein [Micromonosporaceae bacterium]